MDQGRRLTPVVQVKLRRRWRAIDTWPDGGQSERSRKVVDYRKSPSRPQGRQNATKMCRRMPLLPVETAVQV